MGETTGTAGYWCAIQGCAAPVLRAGFKLCKNHAAEQKAGAIVTCPACKAYYPRRLGRCPNPHKAPARPVPTTRPAGARPATATAAAAAKAPADTMLSSTLLGTQFGISPRRVNLVLAELGWIERFTKGWKPTARGAHLGGSTREAKQTGIPYVVWPAAIAKSRALLAAVKEAKGKAFVPPPAAPPAPADPWGNEPGVNPKAVEGVAPPPASDFRAMDGHTFHSHGEMQIDNFLYLQGIAHACGRRLPLDEEATCGFYLPVAKVYIEYVGADEQIGPTDRRGRRKALYEKHQLRFVEVDEKALALLDDELPRLLLKFGIDCA